MTAEINAATRARALEALGSDRFDLLVVGGGITGAGIAREAALRGYRVGLVDKADFASGTSSTSTKLAHGGLRYLEQYDFGLVFEALGERRVLMNIAPHLVRPLQLLFPLYRDRPPHPLKLRAGLILYDLLALGRNIGRHRMLSAAETGKRVLGLGTEGLRGAGLFYDCWAHDTGLVLATLRDAAGAGARLANYVSARLDRPGGVELRDERDGRTGSVKARLVISATGPWTDPFLGGDYLRPSKGVHLAIPRWRLPLDQALATTSPRDGRLVFLIPWDGHTYVGTTDTPYQGSPEAVAMEPWDVDYLLETVNVSFPEARVRSEEVTGSWAGLRPLLRSTTTATYHSSREHAIWEPGPGVLAIAGGKLTTYRVMARQCVDAAVRILRRDHGLEIRPPADTAARPLPGGEPGWDRPPGAALPPGVQEHLIRRYGAETGWIADLGDHEPLIASLPHIEGEVRHAVRRELALTVADVLLRRTHLASRELRASVEAAPRVAAIMAEELGWSAQETRSEVDAYRSWAEAWEGRSQGRT